MKTNAKTCAHIKVTGVRCGSPALRGEQYCYFHYRMLCTSRITHVALLEDGEAIQVSIMEVVNSLLRGTLDVKRGELVLRALNTAVRNSRNSNFGKFDMVRTLPKDPVVQPRPPAPSKEEIAAFEKETLAQYNNPNVGAEALLRPASARPVRETKSETTESSITPHPTNTALGGPPSVNVGTAADSKPALSERSAPKGLSPGGPDVSVRRVDPAQRKPPVGVKQTAAPQERKSAAHGPSGG